MMMIRTIEWNAYSVLWLVLFTCDDDDGNQLSYEMEDFIGI